LTNKQHLNRNFLVGGFLLLLAFTVLITIVGASRVKDIVDRFDLIITGHNQHKNYLTTMRNAARERSIYTWKSTLTKDPFERNEYYEEFLKFGTQFLVARNKLEKMKSFDEKILLDQMRKASQESSVILHQVMEALNLQNEQSEYLYQDELNRALPAQQRLIATLNEMYTRHNIHIQHVYTKITAELTSTITVLLLLMGLALILGSVFAFMIYQRSQKMLSSVIKSEQALAQINAELEQRVEDRTVKLEIVNKRLETMANFDVLTGLANRLMLYNQMKIIISYAKREHHIFAVLFLDLDGFKAINDTFGHDVGDTVLITVADRIRETTRESDLAARLGGDEFIIVLSKISHRKDAEIYSKRLQECINLPIPHSNNPLQVSASIGISLFPDNGDTADLLLKTADNSMYIAKRAHHG